ncbi:LysR family transcriptional regulator [Aminicella lysinilytica]|uniref:LysR family transcriptional regulator n=1 Tax=Aminicella lysinilytica TaxID=433323 RepID=A0A4R6PY71_9FIRM|nr:LysR family transcriptional regulator [Aminicella lysinilytica]
MQFILLDIKQLKYFLAIIEEGNITKAAKRLHIAQPPLSHQLRMLEDELDVKLIERTTKKLHITGAGELLQYRAEQILHLVETTTNELKKYNTEFLGVLSVGTVPSSGGVLLPRLLYSFHDRYPNLNFQIREGDTYRILDMLTNGIIDVGIVRTPFNSEIFESISLPNDPMMAIANGNNLFKANNQSLSLSNLADVPLIIDRRFKLMIVSSCKKAGFKPKILCECDDVRTIISLAETRMGVGIVPKPAICLISKSNMACNEINELSLETRTTLLWLKGRELSHITKEFIHSFDLE